MHAPRLHSRAELTSHSPVRLLLTQNVHFQVYSCGCMTSMCSNLPSALAKFRHCAGTAEACTCQKLGHDPHPIYSLGLTLHLPDPSENGTAAPVIIFFHGFGGKYVVWLSALHSECSQRRKFLLEWYTQDCPPVAASVGRWGANKCIFGKMCGACLVKTCKGRFQLALGKAKEVMPCSCTPGTTHPMRRQPSKMVLHSWSMMSRRAAV